MIASFTVGFDTRVLSIGLQDLSGAFHLSVDEASWLATFGRAPNTCGAGRCLACGCLRRQAGDDWAVYYLRHGVLSHS
jgi:hypothetical protein